MKPSCMGLQAPRACRPRMSLCGAMFKPDPRRCLDIVLQKQRIGSFSRHFAAIRSLHHGRIKYITIYTQDTQVCYLHPNNIIYIYILYYILYYILFIIAFSPCCAPPCSGLLLLSVYMTLRCCCLPLCEGRRSLSPCTEAGKQDFIDQNSTLATVFLLRHGQNSCETRLSPPVLS